MHIYSWLSAVEPGALALAVAGQLILYSVLTNHWSTSVYLCSDKVYSTTPANWFTGVTREWPWDNSAAVPAANQPTSNVRIYTLSFLFDIAQQALYFVVVLVFVFIYEGIWSGLKPGPARPGPAETVDHGS